MSDYVFLANVGKDITSSACLSSFIPNRRSKSISKVDYKVGIYTQSIQSLKWKKLDEIEFKGLNNITIKSTDYDLLVGELVVVVPVGISEQLGDNLDELPKPLSRKVDLSVVSDRGAISFQKGDAFSSYQGDFPFNMSQVKGTFLAFDALTRGNDKDVKSKLIFVNIHSRPIVEKKLFKLCIFDIKTNKMIVCKDYTHNSACIIDIDTSNRSDLIFYSKDTLGIPIFMSYDDNEYLSVEHTHPPSQYFFYNEFKGQQILKKNWLEKLP